MAIVRKTQEYEVRLDQFDGPLDLLLYLVNKAEVNIVDIRVSEVTTQYLAYLDAMRDLNIDIAGEYLNMAATLIRLKARELLPDSPPEALGEGDEDGIFNRDQLVEMMLKYRTFKEAAGALKGFEAREFGAHTRGQAEDPEHLTAPQDEGDGVILGNVSMYDLIAAFRNILERAAVADEAGHVVLVDDCRIDDRIERILTVLSDVGREVRFAELFKDDGRKIALVVTFMALLELVKMRQVSFRQEEQFGEIFVIRGEGNGGD